MANSETEALVRALGELAASLRRRRGVGLTSSAEKRAVLKWLRSLSGEELASLCCVEDVGFAKTLLHMAALSRASRPGDTRIQEFQLLSHIVTGVGTAQNKRTATKTPPRNAPREFVKRPVVRTADGDLSCDTVALSMEFFQPAKKGRKFAADFFHFMETISCGGFLTECPSDTTMKNRVWGETKWLKQQGYYSLHALFVNQIELNIWAFWKQHQKDGSAKIPLHGLASKLYLVHEWEMAGLDRQNAVLKVLGSTTISHLRDLNQSAPIQTAAPQRFQSARSSLEALVSILGKRAQRVDNGVPVDVCFTCSFEDAIANPQAGVIKLLLAEHLQEQCSLLLCERLSKEEEVSISDGVGVTDDKSKVKAKSANHSQRRRASRKKMLKERRREGEIRAAQQTRYNSVLHTAIDDDHLAPGGWSITSELSAKDNRIAQLEEKLTEKAKVMDEQASNASSEITALKQTVATLTAQLHNIENNIQDLQLRQTSANTGGLEDSSLGNASSCGSPAAPFSPAPSSLDHQVDSPPTAAPPLPEEYATANSVMGPFVSVPLSVLPPRSKLHWDLCEFAAQLQADSDARLPAQLAAQRLCTATVQSLWPRAQVRPYGSHVTRLVLPSSDVDLVICLPKVRRDAPADAAGVLEGRNAIKETWQQNLARKLKQEPWVVRDSVKTLPHAAVPIITLLTAPPYNVRLDISFEGPGHNGLATNDVVLALLHEFPPLAPMMLVLKSFAIERGLAVAYSGGLSSYALLLLVARYLQEHSDTMPNGFANASRAVQHSLSTVQAGVADFGLMLMGFLDFYGNRFDPRTTGISVASRCFLNRESTFMAGAVAGSTGMGDPHHQYQQQYAADDAAVDDRTSQYGYAQHWQVPAQPHMQLSPNAEAAQGLRRYGYRSSLDLPASRALDGMGAATGLLDYQQLQQQTYDPHKFDPVFIEDPLCPSNNVGRNCFRIMQIRRAFSAAHLALLTASRDPTMFADNRMGLVAGVGLHPDNILRAILGPGAPVNAKPDAATSATVGTSYMGGMEHPQSQRQSSLKQIDGQSIAKVLSRKNSERSMSLSLSFADVVRDGGCSSGAAANVPKTSPLALARLARFSRDDMALEESINERWETKDDSELK
ncbi:hypothetical protein JG688_00002335 [Phytophthora aleatoria]|uniref:Poly(A) RNA polymerase mitochondrial-like central palm domain-containing protein n=1 Tax=Phytophthora aleatoria TaxID=2496075 RepID=A0A8J5MHU9_9STRA|nr:hypothetical protein JG688_00002335 [Phytophthora aleatoria]